MCRGRPVTSWAAARGQVRGSSASSQPDRTARRAAGGGKQRSAAGVGLAHDERLVGRRADVLGARAVADLALHVLQLVDVRDGAAAGQLVADDVTADALEVELLELRRERGVRRAQWGGVVPHLARPGVTRRAELHPDVRGLVGARCRGACDRRRRCGCGRRRPCSTRAGRPRPTDPCPSTRGSPSRHSGRSSPGSGGGAGRRARPAATRGLRASLRRAASTSAGATLRVALPGRDLHVQIVDAARSGPRACWRWLETGRVGELDDVLPGTGSRGRTGREHRDALEPGDSPPCTTSTLPTCSPCGALVFESPLDFADPTTTAVELGHGVGDALGLTAAHGGQGHEHLGPLALGVVDPAAHDVGDADAACPRRRAARSRRSRSFTPPTSRTIACPSSITGAAPDAAARRVKPSGPSSQSLAPGASAAKPSAP